MYDYDLIVIGGGIAGYTAALKASSFNKRVALFENNKLGGTCLNRGCIPTKSLLKTSVYYSTYADNLLLATKHIDTLRFNLENLMIKQKINIINETACITSIHQVSYNNISLSSEYIIIATGSTPIIPNIKGINIDNIYTSDFFFTHGVDTKELVIVGGGVIGTEMALVYSNLGCKVTIIEQEHTILSNFDREISQNLTMIYKKKGINIFTNTKVLEFIKDNHIICKCINSNNEEILIPTECVLLSVGRCPNTSNLYSSDISINLDYKSIIVNDNYQTSIANIFAIGDVIKGSLQLAHLAEAQACNVINFLYNNSFKKNTSLVPMCVYTKPEIAVIGINEKQAKSLVINYRVEKRLTSSNGRSIIENADRGFAKFIISNDTNEILGCCLMCLFASEIISTITLAISQNNTLNDIESIIFPHPTISEFMCN